MDLPGASPLGLLAQGVAVEDAARVNLLATIITDISYDMFVIGPTALFTNQDILKAQTDPKSVIERYWPGASEVLLEHNLQALPRLFWPALDTSHARRVLNWQPEQTFEKWLRQQGWKDGSN